MGKLDGKVAVITGAASGMGRATAVRFAREGAAVVVADLNSQAGEETISEITNCRWKCRVSIHRCRQRDGIESAVRSCAQGVRTARYHLQQRRHRRRDRQTYRRHR